MKSLCFPGGRRLLLLAKKPELGNIKPIKFFAKTVCNKERKAIFWKKENAAKVQRCIGVFVYTGTNES